MKTECQKCGCRDGEQVWKDMRGYVVDGLCKCSCHSEKCCECEGGDIKVGLLAQACPCNCHKEESVEDETKALDAGHLERMKSHVENGGEISRGETWKLFDEVERYEKIYISAVNGRRDFREALRESRKQNASLQERIKELDTSPEELKALRQCRDAALKVKALQDAKTNNFIEQVKALARTILYAQECMKLQEEE